MPEDLAAREVFYVVQASQQNVQAPAITTQYKQAFRQKKKPKRSLLLRE